MSAFTAIRRGSKKPEGVALAQLWDAQLDRAGTDLLVAVSTSVAASDGSRFLTKARPVQDPAIDLHQPLGGKRDHVTQDFDVWGLFHERAQVHHLFGHWRFRRSMKLTSRSYREIVDDRHKAAPSLGRHWRARSFAALLRPATPPPRTRPLDIRRDRFHDSIDFVMSLLVWLRRLDTAKFRAYNGGPPMVKLRTQRTTLEGVVLIEPATRHEDFRGNFVELFNERLYRDAGIGERFVQDNSSVSQRHVLRGIHGDGRTSKLVSCLLGSVYCLIVNNASTSPQYRKWQAFTLSARNGLQLFVPPHFGTSYLVMSEEAVFHYKQTTEYDGTGQFTIKWDDPAYGFWWPITHPILSERDS